MQGTSHLPPGTRPSTTTTTTLVVVAALVVVVASLVVVIASLVVVVSSLVVIAALVVVTTLATVVAALLTLGRGIADSELVLEDQLRRRLANQANIHRRSHQEHRAGRQEQSRADGWQRR